MRVDDYGPLTKRTRITGMGQCPLVLGECVQGQTKERRHFLITSPIGLFSWAEFIRDSGDDGLVVEPSGCWKALAAVEIYLKGRGLPAQGALRVFTPIGPGQGFGTSTADITASLRAVATSWNRTISPEEIARIAIQIEPSDGSMYSGCVAFAHREGVLIEHLGDLPRFESLVVCTGGVVDTIEFDKRRKFFHYSLHDESQLLMAWEMVRHASRTQDTALLARATTVSARINEQLLPKPYFKELSQFVELEGADGIMVAHSGTALALIFDPACADYPERLAEARSLVSRLKPPACFHVSNRAICQRVAMRFFPPEAHSLGLISSGSI